MIKVNGIGGVFLYAEDPAKLAEWYAHNFGLEFNSDSPETSSYMVFPYRDKNDYSIQRSTIFAITKAKKPLGSERGEYMINYQVDDLAGFLQQLQANGIKTAAIEEYQGIGYFSWIEDPEGNHIELYQHQSK